MTEQPGLLARVERLITFCQRAVEHLERGQHTASHTAFQLAQRELEGITDPDLRPEALNMIAETEKALERTRRATGPN